MSPDLAPDLSKEIIVAHNGLPKILIIDDDMDLCKTLSTYVILARCQPEIANSYAQAIEVLKKAEAEGEPFSVATIDRRFVIGQGEEAFSVLEGSAILHYIKVEYPNITCLMISGESITPSEVLDLRDVYGLDYYLSKDRISPPKFARAISRAVERSKVVHNQDKYYGKQGTTLPLSTDDVSSGEQISPSQITTRALREILDVYFDEEELRDVCFDFGKEFDSLGGVGTSGKARELISYSRRHGRFFELVELCQRLRPHAFMRKV